MYTRLYNFLDIHNCIYNLLIASGIVKQINTKHVGETGNIQISTLLTLCSFDTNKLVINV